MEELAKPAIKAVLESDDVTLVPTKFKNTYRHWMENIRDWNISRQLWWGQQIPAYYYSNNPDDFVVAPSIEKALEMAHLKSGNKNLKASDLRQDDDVLDTWFSSWLWPISVFDGIRNPDNEEINYYYPTKDLVTGPDILFFWVARMIISGYEYRKKKPFFKVYLTGLVRDKQGRKMSKQLGNSPDAIKLIEDFGADAVRIGLLFSSAAGNDLLFDESLCQQGKSFANKIWNAYRLIDGWEVDENKSQSIVNRESLQWYDHKFHQTLETINDHFDKYRLSDALMTSYKLIWDDFCSWLLEAIKPSYGDPIDGQTLKEIRSLFEQNLKLLHPFMPFITEELWQDMDKRSQNEALIISQWPIFKSFDVEIINRFDAAKAVIGGIRNFRKEKQIGFKEKLALQVIGSSAEIPFESLIQKMGQLISINYLKSSPEKQGGAFRANGLEFFIPLEGKIDVEKERQKLGEELKYLNGFLVSVQKKLANERFVSNAPEQVIVNERKKEADALEKIEVLQKSLAAL